MTTTTMRLPPVHAAGEEPRTPTAPCASCGHTRWRVWKEEGKGWRWICAFCRPLVVQNPDGTVWRSDAPDPSPGTDEPPSPAQQQDDDPETAPQENAGEPWTDDEEPAQSDEELPEFLR